jgi:hypothetical protein
MIVIYTQAVAYREKGKHKKFSDYCQSLSRILLDNLTVTRLVKKSPAFYGTQRFITVFIRARPILSQMHPLHDFPHSFFPKMHSNIIFPSTPRSYNLSLPFRFSNKNFVNIFHLSHA